MNAVAATVSAALAAFGLTALLVEPVRRLAHRYRVTDRRAAGHRAHRPSTPYLGGLAIAVGTLAPPAAIPLRGRADEVFWLVAAASVALALLGLAHDVRGLGTRVRLAALLVPAALLVTGGARLSLPGPAWLDPMLTAAWLVVVTNSFSLSDKSSSVLPTIGCATAVPVAALLFATGQPHLGLLLVCLAAAYGGFLLHNAPSARIFVGNAGSLFVGLLLCAGVTRLPAGDDRSAHLALVLLLVLPAAVDTGRVVLYRVERRPSGAPARLPAAAAPAARAAAREAGRARR